jgi:hypothetical protein
LKAIVSASISLFLLAHFGASSEAFGQTSDADASAALKELNPLIASGANGVCGSVTPAGSALSVEVSGKIEANTTQLAKAVARLTGSAVGKVQIDQYEGVQQKSLGDVITKNIDCRENYTNNAFIFVRDQSLQLRDRQIPDIGHQPVVYVGTLRNVTTSDSSPFWVQISKAGPGTIVIAQCKGGRHAWRATAEAPAAGGSELHAAGNTNGGGRRFKEAIVGELAGAAFTGQIDFESVPIKDKWSGVFLLSKSDQTPAPSCSGWASNR